MSKNKKVCLIDESYKTREEGIANNNKKCEDSYINGNKLKNYPDFKDYIVEKWVSKPTRDNEFASQGLCHVDKNVLITSYDTEEKKNSILDIVDDKGRRKQLKFDNQSHVGGIAYHEASGKIFVSDGGKVNIYETDYISSLKDGDVLKNYTPVDISKNALNKGEKINASYLAVHNDQLLVGNFIRKDFSDKENLKEYNATIPMLSFYNLNKNGEPVHYDTIEIPYKQVQGMSVYNHNGKDYYLFSTSFGRTNDSKLIISTIEDGQFKTVDTMKLPCMTEQISVNKDGKLGVVFESDCTKYTGATKEIGNVCYIDIESKINDLEKTKEIMDSAVSSLNIVKEKFSDLFCYNSNKEEDNFRNLFAAVESTGEKIVDVAQNIKESEKDSDIEFC